MDRPIAREILPWLAQLGAALALYFCFAARITRDEAVIGVVVAAFAATGSHVVLRAGLIRFAGRARWVAEAWRLPKYAVTGIVDIFAALFRQLSTGRPAASLLLEVPFATDGGEGAPVRRALAVTYTTMTPTSIVLGLDDERRRMIYHQLDRSPVTEMTRRLGAAP
jgi:multisubunit Na+/H+ antiporter MnhE subunit